MNDRAAIAILKYCSYIKLILTNYPYFRFFLHILVWWSLIYSFFFFYGLFLVLNIHWHFLGGIQLFGIIIWILKCNSGDMLIWNNIFHFPLYIDRYLVFHIGLDNLTFHVTFFFFFFLFLDPRSWRCRISCYISLKFFLILIIIFRLDNIWFIFFFFYHITINFYLFITFNHLHDIILIIAFILYNLTLT